MENNLYKLKASFSCIPALSISPTLFELASISKLEIQKNLLFTLSGLFPIIGIMRLLIDRIEE
jgi:hypothetical protein